MARTRKLDARIPPNDLYELSGVLCKKNPAAHVGPDEHAVDFLVPSGTPVLAAADGKVINIQEIDTRWTTPDEDPAKAEHFIRVTIRHADGTKSQYCRIAKESVSAAGLRVDSHVLKGALLGRVSKSSDTTIGDHLHFMVYMLPHFGGHQSIPVPWK